MHHPAQIATYPVQQGIGRILSGSFSDQRNRFSQGQMDHLRLGIACTQQIEDDL
jgi:hypothetical protein